MSLCIDEDENKAAEIYMLSSLILRGYARNSTMFLCRIVGLYMPANGTPRRVIETLSHMGITASYWDLNSLLKEMEEKAKENMKRAAHDPNAVVVYDNFNFMNRVQELAGGNRDKMVNLTTACLLACPEFNGPLLRSSINPSQPFTRQMVLSHILPRRRQSSLVHKFLGIPLLVRC